MNQEELNSIKIYTIQDIEKVEAPAPEALLTAELIEAKLAEIGDRLPPEVISELEVNLKKVGVTEKQCDEIIERVIEGYDGEGHSSELKSIYKKLNELDNYVAYFQQYLENEFQKAGKIKSKNTGALRKEIETDIICISILLKWVEFLLSRAGEANLEEAIRLYVDLGWIDEALGSKMLLLARGLAVPQSEIEKSSKLTARDHIQSLIFIERLRAIELVEDDLSQSGEELR